MRLEVLVDSEGPKIFPLSKPKIVIGSSESCDIILPTKDISRKHLIVVVEGDRYFVVDQGSSNGSYLNEERLVPGRKVEFTSFFPVRLGTGVLITLLSDEEAAASGSELIEFPVRDEAKSSETPTEPKTAMISLKDLQASKTDQLIKQRKTYQGKKQVAGNKKKTTGPSKISKEETQSRFIKGFAVIVIGLGVLYQFVLRPAEVPVAEVKNDAVENKVAPAAKVEVVAKRSELLVDEVDILSKEKLKEMLPVIKCASAPEIQLCERISGAKNGNWGAVQVGTMMVVLLDGTSFFDEGKRYVPFKYQHEGHNPDMQKKNQEISSTYLSAYFIAKGIPADLNLALYEGMNLTFAFFTSDGSEVKMVVTLKDVALKKLKEAFTMQHLDVARMSGPEKLSFLKDYYIVY